MKATTWKAVFAAIGPSPVFEAIAEFAELRAEQRRSALLKQIKIEQRIGFGAEGYHSAARAYTAAILAGCAAEAAMLSGKHNAKEGKQLIAYLKSRSAAPGAP